MSDALLGDGNNFRCVGHVKTRRGLHSDAIRAHNNAVQEIMKIPQIHKLDPLTRRVEYKVDWCLKLSSSSYA